VICAGCSLTGQADVQRINPPPKKISSNLRALQKWPLAFRGEQLLHLLHTNYATGDQSSIRQPSCKTLDACTLWLLLGSIDSTREADCCDSRPRSVVCLSVNLPVCYAPAPCKNGQTDRDPVWSRDSWGPRNTVLDGGPWGPKEHCIRRESLGAQGTLY